MELKLGFLASGNGSNVKAILENITNGKLDAKAKVIISNNSGAGVHEVSKSFGIPFCLINKKTVEKYDLDRVITDTLEYYDVNLVVLAGYMKQLGFEVINAYKNRILNIHPALLPKYGGAGMYGHLVHDAVIAGDDSKSGVTVHIVDELYDHGKILRQMTVPRYFEDNSNTLSERVLEVEHVLYTQVLRDIQRDFIKLD
ncbi:Phosphoribosylglycinamide formyltransferase [uncultured archaeon]|nr:Phosphoribosylglycinamide formyltransferase [uncultured archaeon]